MAKILYGVMGDAGGHVNRARIIANQMPEHEFLFLGGGKVSRLARDGHHVQKLPVVSTHYKSNSVDIAATAANALRVAGQWPSTLRKLRWLIRTFDPDLIITDYEYFTPIAAQQAGRFCLSLDHQHILTQCRYDPPPEQAFSRRLTSFVVKRFYSYAHHYLITSFFLLEPLDRRASEIFPALIREEVTQWAPATGSHVLVYQTSPTFHRLLPVLEAMGTPFFVYGFGALPKRKNIEFRPYSDEGFLRDLATARYVIANGGHNVISEALYLGKPVLSFPILNAYEQFLNAYFLHKLGYGSYANTREPTARLLIGFENKLEYFRNRIATGNFLGNSLVSQRLRDFLAVPRREGQ